MVCSCPANLKQWKRNERAHDTMCTRTHILNIVINCQNARFRLSVFSMAFHRQELWDRKGESKNRMSFIFSFTFYWHVFVAACLKILYGRTSTCNKWWAKSGGSCKQLNAIYRFRRAEREKGGEKNMAGQLKIESCTPNWPVGCFHGRKKKEGAWKKKCCFDWNRSWQCCAHRLVPLAASHLKKI